VKFKVSRCEFGEPKEEAHGKGLVPFAKRLMGLKNTSKESLCEQLV